MLGYFCTNYMRTNLGMTMTCMINSTALSLLENSSHPQTNFSSSSNCVYTDGTFNHINDYGGTLIWPTVTQDWLFTATFWGSLISTLPGGYFVVLTSPILLLGLSTLIIIFSTAIFPLLVFQTSEYLVFASRFLLGIGVGPILPAMDSLIVRWVPNSEKGLAVSIYTTGVQLSGALGIPFTVFMCASGWKWPAVYYITAAAAIVWLILFCTTVQNSPSESKFITDKERVYLEETIEETDVITKDDIPWKPMLTSIPLLACYACQFSNSVSLTLLQAYQPTFFKEILFLPVYENGIYCAITNIVLCIFKILWGIIMHEVANKFSHTTTCKLSQGFAGIGAASNGFYTSMVSIAPPFVGILSSISKMFALLGMLSTPYIVTAFRKEETIGEWRSIFFIIAGISLVTGILFLFFGKCEASSWAKSEKKHPEISHKYARHVSSIHVLH
uniref:Major facilitator superfamily (MFS) profile domain-containing protein n=1 Tax=Acrobeloides nanus TaxID=290746 RepID=A0A914E2X0_9BILA